MLTSATLCITSLFLGYTILKKRRVDTSMFFKQRKSPPENPLLKEIDQTKTELEAAYSRFENVIDPDLINCSIYQINAIQERYAFLLKQMKTISARETKQSPASH